jgi:hypothetical protein
MLGVVNWCFDRKVAATLLADMNGVIHNCSHGSDTDINTRMTEDEMVGGDLLLCRWAALSLFSVGGFFMSPNALDVDVVVVATRSPTAHLRAPRCERKSPKENLA